MHKTNYPSITKFQEHVELKDFRKPTKKEYVRYVRKLAEHFQCDPATLTEDQLRQYFIFLREHKHYSRSPMQMAKYALLCFYVECLKVSGWTVFREVRIAHPQVLPAVLTRQEVKAVLGAVSEPRFRTCLGLMYHCGLRVGEAVRIQIKDIQGRQEQPRLLVRHGKGGKQRYVPLSPGMVRELRAWWRIHQNPEYLFPTPGRGWADRTLTLSQSMHQNKGPMSESCVQAAYRMARAASGVNPGSTTHTLRHSYATHLLEEGVSLRQISTYLGHETLDTTVIYTHLTNVSEARTQAALDKLYHALKA
jgi:integrase